MDAGPLGGSQARLDDQLQFYAEKMYDFNREIERYLHEDLGCKQLVNAGNWRTADAAKLDDAERWSYTANEVLAINRYYSPVHIGPDRGWRINPGDFFEDVSVLKRPHELPLNLKQVVGHPMMVTESHWVPPLGYQAEGPFLVAAYQSLTGVDVFYWFATGEAEWANQDRAEWDSASRAKWVIATPMILGQFPAAALLFRKGYLKEGEPVVEEHRTLNQIWERVPPILAEDPGYDPNRDLGDSAPPCELERERRSSGILGRAGESALRLQTGAAQELPTLALSSTTRRKSFAPTRVKFDGITDMAFALLTLPRPREPPAFSTRWRRWS